MAMARTGLKQQTAYVKLSTMVVEKSVDDLRVELPSAGSADDFCFLVRKSPGLD
jgi:hypothetical protein